MAQPDIDYNELRHMAWASTVPADGDWEAQARERIEWLKGQTPEDWHRFALGFNWGDDLAPLEWIVQQETCDMATALLVFWRSEPAWDLMMMAEEGTGYSRSESALITTIANRICEKGYWRRKIAWDAEPGNHADFEDMKRYVAGIDNPPWRPHKRMLKTIWGAEVLDSEEAWEERPDNVRTGFWLDLPDSGIITPRARARMREQQIAVPSRELGVVFAALFTLGAATMFMCVEMAGMLRSNLDGLLGAVPYPTVLQIGILVGLILPIWFGLQWAGREYTYRRLFG